MATAAASSRPPSSAGPAESGLIRVLRAELTKFRTVRGWTAGLGAAVLAFVLVSYLSAAFSRAPVPVIPTGPGGEAVTDTYTLEHQSLIGNGTITARIDSFTGAYVPPLTAPGSAISSSSSSQPGSHLSRGLAPWAKAGLILEPGTSQGTTYAAVMVTGSHGVRMEYNYTHDTPGWPGRISSSGNSWLQLARVGDVITGYDSVDGTHWIRIGTARLADLPRTVQIGFFVASPAYFTRGASTGDPSVATATFDEVSAHGNLPRQRWSGEAVAGFYPAVPAASTWRQLAAGTFTVSGSGDIAPLVGDILSAQWAGASIVNGTIIALMFVIVLGAVLATSEYRRGLIHTTFAASPARARVLAAKAAVAGSLAFAAGATATAAAEAITRHLLAANGSYLFPQSGPVLAQVILGTGVFLGLAAALTVALGMMFRRALPTVTAGFALLILPGILGSQSGNWLMRLTPTAAFAIQATLPRSDLVTTSYTPPNGYFPVGPWSGLAVLGAYTAAAFAVAAWLLRRRDA